MICQKIINILTFPLWFPIWWCLHKPEKIVRCDGGIPDTYWGTSPIEGLIEYARMLDTIERQIASAYGVPPELLGYKKEEKHAKHKFQISDHN